MAFRLKFWGVRGSIACPSPNHVIYGGNTSCLEVDCDDRRIVLDAGTGIRNLGNAFMREGVTSSHILLTHTHWDHINGFPFFAPVFKPGNSFHVMAGHLHDKVGQGGIQGVMAKQMDNPTFPVPLEALQAKLTFEDFVAGETLDLHDDIKVRTAPLNHPNGATGYRVEYHGKSIVYITDHEHVPDQPDKNVLALIQDADLVVYDSTYTDDEFPAKVGWGHSTWQEGVRLAKMANVKRLVIFHHDPDHDDAFMGKLEDEARNVWDGAMVAREGMEITLA